MSEVLIASGEANVIHKITELRRIYANNVFHVTGGGLGHGGVYRVGYSFATLHGSIAIVAFDSVWTAQFDAAPGWSESHLVVYVKNNYQHLYQCELSFLFYTILTDTVAVQTEALGVICRMETQALIIGGCFFFPMAGVAISAVKLILLYNSNQEKFHLIMQKSGPLYDAAMLMKDHFPITTRIIISAAFTDAAREYFRPHRPSAEDIAKGAWSLLRALFDVYTGRFEHGIGNTLTKQMVVCAKSMIIRKLRFIKESVLEALRHPVRTVRHAAHERISEGLHNPVEPIVERAESVLHQIESDDTLFRRITADFSSLRNSYSLHISEADVRAIIREIAQKQNQFNIIEDFSRKLEEVVEILDQLNHELERMPSTSL
ncbi:MAG: hypothetical protein IPO39_00395 [Bacteroidetes bacterium]|nr:hypothetical protein [Bacteroidota bacterium]MBK9523237.1 hypothetical protein [Bacteroidota bacterium]MBK9540982.1 hypothetical protein [Bacteroidota bacterium]MBP6403028.1 hypothetical protein [Bacteroidia bacterium]MBP6649021.1 hypothetical protein [Bacteroidia bacterium]